MNLVTRIRWLIACSALLVTDLSLAADGEMGKIEPGTYWDHILAAYVVIWVAIIGYVVSIRMRKPSDAGDTQ